MSPETWPIDEASFAAHQPSALHPEAFLLEVRTQFLAISNVLPILAFAGRILSRDKSLSFTQRQSQ
jgi:hypothetical protein